MNKHRYSLSVMAFLISSIALFLLHASPAGAQAPGVVFTMQAGGTSMSVPLPAGWSGAQSGNGGVLTNGAFGGAKIIVSTEERRDHAGALNRLKNIVAQEDASWTVLSIGGWPALQRRFLAPKEQGRHVTAPMTVWNQTTAIAAGNLLVRLESAVGQDSPASLLDQIEAIGRSCVFSIAGNPAQTQQEIQDLGQGQNPTPTDSMLPVAPLRATTLAAAAPLSDPPGVAPTVRVTNVTDNPFGNVASEVAIAASKDGKNIVIGTNPTGLDSVSGADHFSADGGQTWQDSILTGGNTEGDPSVVFGPSGNFYASNINNSSIQIRVSIDKGANFTFLANAFTCTTTTGDPDTCGFIDFDGLPIPDQPHIAVDPVNLGHTGGDQLYAVWRHGGGLYGIVCSEDSGKTWTAPGTINYTAGLFPRITVGQDGFVWVVYRDGRNVSVNKYAPCKDNPSPKPEPDSPGGIIAINGVPCPLPGYDRCDGNFGIAGHTVAVDDTNPNHLYLIYANNSSFNSSTGLGNENIRIIDSRDGFNNDFGGPLIVNTAVAGRRFMPWVSVVNGRAYVTWYDRRFATTDANDLTDYFAGSAFRNTAGNLAIGPEVRISEVSDPQCGNFWPSPPFSPLDAASCSTPQLAGGCGTCDATGNNCAFDPSFTRCDYKACNPCYSGTHKCVGTGLSCTSQADCKPSDGCQCAPGEICLAGDGYPKYGDFNENTTSHVPGYFPGQLLASWASATSPPGLPPTTGIQTYFSTYRRPVDCTDLSIVKASFGKKSGQTGFDPRADVNGDGIVDVRDLATVSRQLPAGTHCP